MNKYETTKALKTIKFKHINSKRERERETEKDLSIFVFTTI